MPPISAKLMMTPCDCFSIDAAELLRGLLNQSLNVREAAKIGLQGDTFSSQLRDFGNGSVRFGLRPVVMDYDVGAFRGQTHGYGSPDALGGAGDQRDATLQCKFHVER